MEKRSSVFSLCGMCSTRCLIRVEVADGRPVWIEGNPHVPGIERSLCAKGAAGLAFEYDDERPQSPMLRDGPRGSGRWRQIGWDEALDYIAGKLDAVTRAHGARAIAIADRGGPFTDLTRSFIRALGSPNYFDHDDTCGKNVNMASQSLFGYGRADWCYDYRHARQIVLYGRNVFESLQVKEVNEILDAMAAGATLTYIDIRATVTAAKAHHFLRIRPGTDYALNLALIHLLLAKNLYDADFAARWITGLDELKRAVENCTPAWAEAQTGVAANAIIDLAHRLAGARPRVILHGGWMLARYGDSFYNSRAIWILNALLGNIESPGGLIVAKGAKEAGAMPLNSLSEGMPPVTEPIVDAEMPGAPLGTGHIINLYKAIESGLPYPVKAFFAYRYDPIASLPDPDRQRQVLDHLDLLVSIDVNYSQTGWYSDLILPESTYLERSSIIATLRGTRPQHVMREQAMAPRFDSRPAWEIFAAIAKRCGAGDRFPWSSIGEIREHQLRGTGLTAADFLATGMVQLAERPLLMDHDALKFPTPSGKIEIVSPLLQRKGAPPLAPFVAPAAPPAGEFRLTFGRSAVQAHAQSQNNPWLHELLPENELWINRDAAQRLEIADGDLVELSAGAVRGRIRARVTPRIHPEAVFMLHGFGCEIPAKSRAFGKGLSDNRFAVGGLYRVDPVGGGGALLEYTVQVRKVAP